MRAKFQLFFLRIISSGVFLGVLAIILQADAAAQTSNSDWSTPLNLFEGLGSLSEPALASDQTGKIHAFWAYEEEDSPMAIFYTRWDGQNWTNPVDVIAMSSIQGPSAVVDQFGQIHLIWSGPEDTLFYSSSNVTDAASANGWSSPLLLASSNAHAQISVDQNGVLHVVYPALMEEGVKYLSSEDSGKTWTPPSLISNVVNANATTDFARFNLGPNGYIYVVWTELASPIGWPPKGVYFAQSTDHGNSWSAPIELAGAGFLEANIVVSDKDTIHVAWNAQADIAGRYLRWSSDNGRSWSQVLDLASSQLGGGSTNPPAMIVDSDNMVHIVMNTQPGGRVGTDATMYVYGKKNTWSNPLDISGQASGYLGLINEASTLEVSEGNQLSVLFKDNDGARIWYTSKTSNAPNIAPIDFLTDQNKVVGESSNNLEITDLSPKGESVPESSGIRRNEEFGDLLIDPSTSLNTFSVALILPLLFVVGAVILIRLAKR